MCHHRNVLVIFKQKRQTSATVFSLENVGTEAWCEGRSLHVQRLFLNLPAHFNLSVQDEPNILTFALIVTRPLYQSFLLLWHCAVPALRGRLCELLTLNFAQRKLLSKSNSSPHVLPVPLLE